MNEGQEVEVDLREFVPREPVSKLESKRYPYVPLGEDADVERNLDLLLSETLRALRDCVCEK